MLLAKNKNSSPIKKIFNYPVCGTNWVSKDNFKPFRSWSSTVMSVARRLSVFHFWQKVKPINTQNSWHNNYIKQIPTRSLFTSISKSVLDNQGTGKQKQVISLKNGMPATRQKFSSKCFINLKRILNSNAFIGKTYFIDLALNT